MQEMKHCRRYGKETGIKHRQPLNVKPKMSILKTDYLHSQIAVTRFNLTDLPVKICSLKPKIVGFRSA